MNTLPKVFIRVALVITLTFLIFPLSSITVNATESELNEEIQGISMGFNDISIAAISTLISDLLGLQASVNPSIQNEKINLSLDKVPKYKLLEVISKKLNVSFTQEGEKLVVEPLPGGINIIKEAGEKPKPGDIGVALDLNIKFEDAKGQSITTKTRDTQLWSHFNVPFSIFIGDNYEVEFIVNDTDTNTKLVLIDSKIYEILANGKKKALFNPKLAVWVSKQGIIEISDDDGGKWEMSMTPYKKKYYEVER
jgi:hypothetical protein